MSTTTVCRGLQSCLEPQLGEPLTLRLKLAPHKLHFPQPSIRVGVTSHVSDSDSYTGECEEVYNHEESSNNNNNINANNNTSNGDFGGWSFLTKITKEAKEDKEAPYVHPLDKRSSSTLSNKSLELCTESLGSETGSDIGDNTDISDSESSKNSKSPTRERSRLCQLSHKKANRQSFPPPLTSISGSDYVQFTPHREGGRLIIKAITIAPSPTCFQAERGDGRLRLRFAKNYNSSSSEEDNENDEEEKEDQEEVEEQQDNVSCLSEEIDGNNVNVEGEMGIGKYQRYCRYKESGHGNKRLLNWEPLLGVAT